MLVFNHVVTEFCIIAFDSKRFTRSLNRVKVFLTVYRAFRFAHYEH